MTKNEIKYIIITPVRNEQEYIEQVFKSITKQTIKPIQWIVVDDGSTDRTAEIIDNIVERNSWVRCIHRDNRGYRKSGQGVIEAFYDGYNLINVTNWDFIVKLDADLIFEKTYFEKCFREFQKNSKLGITGGEVYSIKNGKSIIDYSPKFHVRGATKIYRSECWHDLKGIYKLTGWDTLDEMEAQRLGWQTYTLKDVKIQQLRLTGYSEAVYKNWFKNGRANYIAGYHPIFMVLKCIKRLFYKPYILSSLLLFLGYFSGYLMKIPQVPNHELIWYIRKQQKNKLLFKKNIWD